jgi:hypothetical protein
MMHTVLSVLIVLACGAPAGAGGGAATAPGTDDPAARRKTEYVAAVVRGEGFLPWQERGVSTAEASFREEVERRKDEMLAARMPVSHAVMLSAAEVGELRRKVADAAWAREAFTRAKDIADYLIAQPEQHVAEMIPALTPKNSYGLTCPRCVGKKSQEGAGLSGFAWDYHNPDVLVCKACGLRLPNEEYPETAKLVCPRSGQEFTCYLNAEERGHPDDRSGKLAFHWVGHPVHMSYSGVIREQKIKFMIGSLRDLALAYAVTEQPAYAERAAAILDRLASTYRHWLYHDYWDTIADCDPMYAAWHWRRLDGFIRAPTRSVSWRARSWRTI